MPRASPTRRVTGGQARAYAGKAEEYLEAARESLSLRRFNAATSLAVHAGINAGDAVTGARQGIRSAGSDHSAAIKLLAASGRDGAEGAKYLRRLLPLKTRAEYDPLPIPKQQAETAVRAAEQLTALARRVILSLG